MKDFKPLLPFHGNSFVQNIVLKLNSVCDKIIIVTGYKANAVIENVEQLIINPKVEFVFNKLYEKGMFTSLQKGLSAVAESDWVLYHFVDQPGLPDKFYTEFIQKVDDLHNWIQPSYKKQAGHPILIHKALFNFIASASPDSSLREISKIQSVKRKFWECEFEEILLDIDTDEDYAKL